MPRVHPNDKKEEKSKRFRLKSKSSESKEESSESEESLYNSWKNKLKRLKRNRRINKTEQDKQHQTADISKPNESNPVKSNVKTKSRKKKKENGEVDWESKTPFVFTFSPNSFPPIAEAEETFFIEDTIPGKLAHVAVVSLFIQTNLLTCLYKNSWTLILKFFYSFYIQEKG